MTENKPVPTEEKAIATIDPERLARLREMTGEGNKPYASMNVPQLSIDSVEELDPKKKGDDPVKNPNYGKFKITTRSKGDDGKWESDVEYLDDKIKVVILKKRFYASKWNDAMGLPEFYTPDFDDWSNIVVMQNDLSSGSLKKTEVARGSYSDLKEKYDLSPNLILFVLYGDKILRLKGSSTALGEWFDYEKLFAGSSFAIVETELSSIRTRKTEKMPFYRLLQFKQAGIADDSVVFPMIQQLNTELQMYEAYQGMLEEEGVTDSDIEEVFVDAKPVETEEDTRVVPDDAKPAGNQSFDL